MESYNNFLCGKRCQEKRKIKDAERLAGISQKEATAAYMAQLASGDSGTERGAGPGGSIGTIVLVSGLLVTLGVVGFIVYRKLKRKD